MGQYLPNQGAPFIATSVNDADGSQIQVMTNGFAVPKYDEIVMGYTGENLTSAVYKLASSTVATLTFSYTGENLTGIIKS